ncbi:MAG: YdeI/OmpD-associated family protein [Planctomycetes bacterium]|nr:YdeI/OmpD-associated family protein [Planctomycetota bacterium]
MADDSRKVDAYIAQAAPFARPILERIRSAVHRGCPDIEERIKWGVPSFEKDGMVCGMAAFKAHATFGFWRGKLLDDPHEILRAKGTASFMAEKLTKVSQLPKDSILADYVKRAAALNERLAREPKKPSTPRKKRPEAKVPPDLAAALKRNADARATFEGFPPGQRREYVEWITEAKQEETRKRRLAQAVEWMAEGKIRNWKYANC